jgi:hypothetical protein
MKARYDQLAKSAGYQGERVAVSSYPEEREVTKAADFLGGSLISPVSMTLNNGFSGIPEQK